MINHTPHPIDAIGIPAELPANVNLAGLPQLGLVGVDVMVDPLRAGDVAELARGLGDIPPTAMC